MAAPIWTKLHIIIFGPTRRPAQEWVSEAETCLLPVVFS